MDAANPTTDTPINLGKKVLVVGGGNTAMDSCRTAKRLGAEVTLVYRRSEQEMPARLEEVKHAKEEGINFLTLHNPIEYLADENGAVKAAVLQVMEPIGTQEHRGPGTGSQEHHCGERRHAVGPLRDLCWWRHRSWWCYGDSGYGRRTSCSSEHGPISTVKIAV